MGNYKKVTYTLDQRIINIIERRAYLSDKSQSRWLSDLYSVRISDDGR